MEWIVESPEVFYLPQENKSVAKSDLERLKNHALKNNRKIARLCLHSNVTGVLHEMFILLLQQGYLPPLKQVDKVTSFHVIEGDLDIYLLTENGEVSDVLPLGNYESGKLFYFRAPKNVYRMMLPRTEFVLYHEVTIGPFKNEDTIFAPWAPEEGDEVGIKKFISQLTQVR